MYKGVYVMYCPHCEHRRPVTGGVCEFCGDTVT